MAVWYAANSEKLKAWQITYRAENPEKYSARKVKNAAYHLANREKILEQKSAYRSANREKISEKNANWSAANRELAKANSATWRAANPEKCRIHDQNRKARKRANGGKLSSDLSAKLFKLQRGKCTCCGLPLGDNYHLDHVIPLALGGANEDSNIQLLRAECNLKKSSKHPVDFMQSRGFLL